MADRISNKTVSVGVTQVNVSPEVLLGQRKYISIINTSTGGQKITIAVNSDAVLGNGIVLSPGGSYSDSQDGVAYYPPNFNIQAISDLAGGSLAVLERIGNEVK